MKKITLFLVFFAVFAKATPPENFNGIKLGADGRLIPSAYDKVKTFENGKTPLREVFVSVNGSDVTGNGTFEKPFVTIAKALDAVSDGKAVRPGTAIRIMPGEYNESLTLVDRLIGTEEAPIWIGGYSATDRPVMKHPNGFIKYTGAYVILHDLEVIHIPPYKQGVHGIYPYGDFVNQKASHHFVLRNLYVHHIGDSPIKTSTVDYYWLFDCEVSFGQQGLRGSGSIDNVGSHYATVAYNYLHHSVGIGIVFKGGSSEVDIHNNLIVEPGVTGVSMGQSTGFQYFYPALTSLKEEERFEAHDIRTYSNIFIGGICPFYMTSSKDCYFVNNTVIHPSTHLFRHFNMTVEDGTSYSIPPADPAIYRLFKGGASLNNTIANNIFYFYGDQSIRIHPRTNHETLVLHNNLFFHAKAQTTELRYDMQVVLPENMINAIIGKDPLFEDFLNNNFRLKANSPAIGAGINLPFVKKDGKSFAVEDFEGKPFASPRTIGAIQ